MVSSIKAMVRKRHLVHPDMLPDKSCGSFLQALVTGFTTKIRSPYTLLMQTNPPAVAMGKMPLEIVYGGPESEKWFHSLAGVSKI